MVKTIALAGNPNVGKSTIFNAFTGMNQHTGNWTGKTVSKAEGNYLFNNEEYCLVDLPGTYSLFAHSMEEEIARDFICFNHSQCVVVVCDATSLQRNLNLVLQTLEITSNVVVCVNLLDEAYKKNIKIDLLKLESLLGVRVIGTSARNKDGLLELQNAIEDCCKHHQKGIKILYTKYIEELINLFSAVIVDQSVSSTRWISLCLLQDHHNDNLNDFLKSLPHQEEIHEVKKQADEIMVLHNITMQDFKDTLVNCVIQEAEIIAGWVVNNENKISDLQTRKIDHLLTSKKTGVLIMLCLLCFIFWITIFAANVPSTLLADALFSLEDKMDIFLTQLNVSNILIEMLVHGVYRVLAWVVSVMLPPMAIFFPLFTLLEDLGYLPRIAFNLDHYFKKACTCGKQALTICQGFGCNAVGVMGCRIIDSKREQLIAILTNNFVPCNGRFPTIIAIISMFFIGSNGGFLQSLLSALLLTSVVVLGILLTFVSSYILSKTLLKGESSSFTLELPPYRRPQIFKVIIRSMIDRTFKVLGRAVIVAAPAGLLIWLMANIQIQDATLLDVLSQFFDPFGKAIGMDGVIILAFILGFPANEIVIPIMVMIYMSSGNLVELDHANLYKLLLANDWTYLTALNTMLFTLLHWPCSTTCITIKKETGSIKWALVGFLLPTLFGISICFFITLIANLFI